MDARAANSKLKRRAADGQSLQALSRPALDVLSRSAATVSGVLFDDDVRQMAVRLTDSTMIHGGLVAGEERLRAARLLAGYLHTLAHGGVHMITPDERQAQEEGELARTVYGPLGVSVGVLQEDMAEEERRAAYGADVTVGPIAGSAWTCFMTGRPRQRMTGSAGRCPRPWSRTQATC